MNPVVQELRSKMHHTTTPSWANRAAAEIERLERERDELRAVVQELEAAVLSASDLLDAEQFDAAEITVECAAIGIRERREAKARGQQP